MDKDGTYRATCFACSGKGVETRSALTLILFYFEWPRKDGKCWRCNGKGYIFWWPDEYPREAS